MVFGLLFGNQIGTIELEARILVWTFSNYKQRAEN